MHSWKMTETTNFFNKNNYNKYIDLALFWMENLQMDSDFPFFTIDYSFCLENWIKITAEFN